MSVLSIAHAAISPSYYVPIYSFTLNKEMETHPTTNFNFIENGPSLYIMHKLSEFYEGSFQAFHYQWWICKGKLM